MWPWTLAGLAVGTLISLAFALLAPTAGDAEQAAAQAAQTVDTTARCTFPVSRLVWSMAPPTSDTFRLAISGCWMIFYAGVGTLVGLRVDRRSGLLGLRPASALFALACVVAPAASYGLVAML
ncbi:MAG: hypothetical protein AB8H80_07370 [Planctomycetota bacterium]